MKKLSGALFVTALLTALIGVTPASASPPAGTGATVQATLAAAAPAPPSRSAVPGQRVKAVLPATGRASTSPAPRVAAVQAALPAAGAGWTNLGPRSIVSPAQVNAFNYGTVSGRVTALAVDPSTPATVYAGSGGGGVWKSLDAGVSWAPVSDGQASGAIGAIAIDPSNSQTVYAATGEDDACIDICPPSRGILKTTDGGASWALVGASTFDTAATGSYFFFGSIAVDRVTHLHLIAATNQGLYSSSDGGTTWSRNSQLQMAATAITGKTANGTVMQVLQDPVTPTKWWAAVSDWCTTEGGDVMSSTDGGSGWTVSQTFADPFISGGAERISIAVAKDSGGSTNVYAEVSGCSSPQSSGGNGPYKFVQGSGWSKVAETATNVMRPPSGGSAAQGFWDNTIAIDPANAAHVLVGGVTVIASSDAGAHWSDVGQVYSNTGTAIHSDFHALAFTPTGGTAYAGNDGGLWKTTDLGAHWTNLNATLQLTQYYAGFSKDLATFAGGAQDNGTSGRYAGAPSAPSLGQINGGDGGWTQFRSGSQYYTESQLGDMQIVDTSLLATNANNFTENGPCVQPASIGPACAEVNASRTAFVTPFVTSPASSDRLYVGTYRIWRSTTGGLPSDGSSYTAISGDLTTGGTDTLQQIAIRSIGGHDAVVAASGGGRISISTDAGAPSPTWTDITGNLPARTAGNSLPYNPFIPAITINPNDAGELWIALGSLTLGRVWHTVNAGASTTWTDLSGAGLAGLPVVLTKSIAVAPNDPSNVVVGTDAGAYICLTCGGAGAAPSWSPLGTGLPNSRVQYLSVTDDGVNLVAWTHGRGAWTIPFPLDSFAVTTSTSTPTANTAFDVTISVRRPDASADMSYRGTVHLTSSDPGSPTLPGDYTFTAADNGTHTFSTGVKLKTAGSQTITATDAARSGITGTSASLTVAATLPDAPLIGTASAANQSATVNWSVPAYNGGSAITGYRITPFIGATAQTPVPTGSTATSFLVTGLTNGTAYTFSVAAQNVAGTGPDSAHSNSVTPTTLPGPPTGVAGTPGDQQVALTWTAGSDGGSAITGYQVSPFIGATAQPPITLAWTATNYTVMGLTNGTAYTFKVAAINSVGTGPDSSASSPIVPRTIPGTPTGVAGTPGAGQVTLTWTPPASDGGSAITGYRVTPYIGASARPALLTGSAAAGYTVTGLTNGTAYTFKIAAINVAGTGSDSTASSPVTPNLTYYFTWYDKISDAGFTADDIHVVNAGGSTAHVAIHMPGSPGCDFADTVGPGIDKNWSCATGFGGPATVTSDLPVNASQRVKYNQSFNEVAAQPGTAASTSLALTWYDLISDAGFKADNVHVVNPGPSASTVHVHIPGFPACDYSGVVIAAGGYQVFNCGSGFGGPVTVNASNPVLASQRVKYNASFNESAAQPTGAGALHLLYTWYDKISDPGFKADDVHVINPGASTANVRVHIPGSPACDLNGTVSAGADAYFSCATGFGGPVTVDSDQPVLGSQRVKYYASFNEVAAAGTTSGSLTRSFTWFDAISDPGFKSDNIHVVNPATNSQPAVVSIHIPGQPACDYSGQSIAPGSERYFSCPTGFGGPVTITASGASVIASQRVKFYQSFNEVGAF